VTTRAASTSGRHVLRQLERRLVTAGDSADEIVRSFAHTPDPDAAAAVTEDLLPDLAFMHRLLREGALRHDSSLATLEQETGD
jgi:hypothetical protein